jgi:hypothetical protein
MLDAVVVGDSVRVVDEGTMMKTTATHARGREPWR